MTSRTDLNVPFVSARFRHGFSRRRFRKSVRWKRRREKCKKPPRSSSSSSSSSSRASSSSSAFPRASFLSYSPSEPSYLVVSSSTGSTKSNHHHPPRDAAAYSAAVYNSSSSSRPPSSPRLVVGDGGGGRCWSEPQHFFCGFFVSFFSPKNPKSCIFRVLKYFANPKPYREKKRGAFLELH